MKAQTKMIAASLVVIMLALSAVGGITYSWFSDEEKADVSITTGSINLDMGPITYSYTELGNPIENSDLSDFVSTDNTNQESYTKLNVSAMKPGDKLTLNYEGTLTTTIDVIFTVAIDYVDPFEISKSFTVNNQTVVGSVEGKYADSGVAVGGTVTIELPETVGNEFMGKQYEIGVRIGAYQSNIDQNEIPKDSYTVTKSIDTTNEFVEVKTENVTITFPEGSVKDNTEVTVKEVSEIQENSPSFNIKDNGTIVSGVDVTFNTNGGLNTDKHAIVTMVLNGTYDELAIYHESDRLTEVDSESDLSAGMYLIQDDGSNTTVTIYASGFSAYYAVELDPVVEIDGEKYTDFNNALENADGKTITVINDINVDETLIISTDSKIILDLNGYSITNYKEGHVFRVLGDLTIKDDSLSKKGKVEAKHGGYTFIVGSNEDNGNNMGKLTIDGGNFIGITSVVSVTQGYVTINDGYFKASEYNGAHEFTLNCVDRFYEITADIFVYGGEFYKFNPGNNAAEGSGTSFVAPSYKAIQSGDVYKVVTKDIIETNEELDLAIKAGNTNLKLSDGTFIIPDSAQKKTLEITGSENTIIVTQDDGSYEGCDYSLDGATVTFNKVKINTDSHTYTGYARLKATYNDCIINGTYTLYGESTFNNCTFNVTGDVYNIWTWGGTDVLFNKCTFNSDGKAILLYNQSINLTVNECTFNDKGGLDSKKAAIETGKDDNSVSYNLIVNKTVVNGYEINDTGINTGTTLWANKNSIGVGELNVVVDGIDVY